MNRSQVVIPAYNEERCIADVVCAAQSADNELVHEQIVVIDNNSTDRTRQIAEGLGATVLSCTTQGKGFAMNTGVWFAEGSQVQSVTFLDGDLVGVTPAHVNALAAPVVSRDSIMNIGYLGERTELQKHVLNYWGGFSGQRAINLSLWNHVRQRDLKGWRTEAALNRIAAHQGLGRHIRRTELVGLRHEGTFDGNTDFVTGTIRYARKYASAMYGLTTSSGKPCLAKGVKV